MPPMTKSQYFWNSARILLFFKIFKLVVGKLKSFGVRKLTTILALVVAGISYRILHRLYDALLCRLFNLQTLNSLDGFFMHDDKDSLSNTGLLMFTDKFEFGAMRDYLHDNIADIPACRRTMSSILGQYYFRKQSREEFKAKWPQVCKEVKGIHT